MEPRIDEEREKNEDLESEQKKTDLRLKESEEKYRIIAENSNDIIAMFGKGFKVEYVNQIPLFSILGYDTNDLIGKRGYKFIHPSDVELILNIFTDRLKLDRGKVEIRLKHKDGYYIWTEASTARFIDKDETTKILVNVRDITEKKQSEQKLRESEEKYRNLFENSPNAILLIDLYGKIVDINSTMEKQSGYQKSEVVGKHFLPYTRVPEKHAPLILKQMQVALKGEITDPMEIQVYIKDESLIWVIVQVSLIKWGDETILQVIFQDISEKK